MDDDHAHLAQELQTIRAQGELDAYSDEDLLTSGVVAIWKKPVKRVKCRYLDVAAPRRRRMKWPEQAVLIEDDTGSIPFPVFGICVTCVRDVRALETPPPLWSHQPHGALRMILHGANI